MTTEDNKALFQRISSGLEANLEQYKNQYPKNLAQMIRHNLGKITVVAVCIILFIMMFCMSLTAGMMLLAGTPGILLFAVMAAAGNKDESVEDNGSLANIHRLKDQLQPLTAYPDVKQYSDGFDKKMDEVTAQKDATRAKFKRYIKTSLIIAGSIIILLILRIEISNQNGTTDQIMQSENDRYIQDVLDLKLDEPFVTLKPSLKGLESPDNEVFFYVCDGFDGNRQIRDEENLNMFASGMKLKCNTTAHDSYVLSITDKDGKIVPRSPRFVFYGNQDASYSNYFDETLRILLYLRNHQQDLRYKVEKI